MSQDVMKQHGAFSWNELVTNHVDKALDFYGKLFGWRMETLHNNGMDYTIVKVGDREVAGIMGIPPDAKGMQPAWGPYITVDDVDSIVEEVESLGGKVSIPPRDIPNVGRFCVVSDPQGAMLSLITYINKE